jgi:hypothetical protein
MAVRGAETASRPPDIHPSPPDNQVDKRRAWDREYRRQRRAMTAPDQRVEAVDVSTRHPPDNPPDPPPAYTTPPKEIKPKRVLSMPKRGLPTDFALTESDKRYALDRGWTETKIAEEFDRFCNNATAKGVKYADWHAAWRNWVTSPFQAPKANGASHNGPPSKPSVSDVLARLCDETSPDFDGLFPQVGRG